MSADGGDGLLLVWADAAAEAETQLARLGALQGVLSARRYEAVDGHPRHLAVCEIADPQALQGARYLELGARQGMAVDSYRRIFSHGPAPLQPADFIMLARMNVVAEREQEFNDWYDSDHVPAYVRLPDILRGRRYVALDATPKYLALYDLNDPDVRGTAAFEKARNSDWTLRMRPHLRDVSGMVFRRC